MTSLSNSRVIDANRVAASIRGTMEKVVPWFQPIAQVLSSRWARAQSPSAVVFAGELVESGRQPQARLHEMGLAAELVCRAY